MACNQGSNCCTPPAITIRINPTTGLPEQSTDNGTTWTPAAGGLQSVIVEPIPPVTSGTSNDSCDAATNLAGQVDVWISQVETDFDTAVSLLEFAIGVLEAILVAVVTVLSAGTLTAVEAAVLPLLGAALFATWGAGKAAFSAYWSTDNRDQVLCAAACTIGDDGSFTDAQFTAFFNRCNTRLPPSPAKMLFMGFLSSVGRQGLNAMAATGLSSSSDCSECHCDDTWCKEWDFTVESFDDVFSSYTPASNPAVYNTNWVPATGWQTANGSPNYSIIKLPLDTAVLTHVLFTLDPTTDATAFMGILSTATADATVNYAVNDRFFDGSEPVGTYLAIGQRDRAVLTYLKIEGTGVNPFGADNC